MLWYLLSEAGAQQQAQENTALKGSLAEERSKLAERQRTIDMSDQEKKINRGMLNKLQADKEMMNKIAMRLAANARRKVGESDEAHNVSNITF